MTTRTTGTSTQLAAISYRMSAALKDAAESIKSRLDPRNT